MRLDCPSCKAGFEVNPKVLEPNGRTVRCAACKTTWFAVAPSFAMAGAEEALAPAPQISVSEEDRADHEALNADRSNVKIEPQEDAELVHVDAAPGISPEAEAPAPLRPKRKTVAPQVSKAPSRRRAIPMGFVAALLFGVLSIGFAARESIVRAAPEMASLYAAIGFPVNLRGLAFQNIQTRQEIQDGIAVLAIEGEVENVANRAVELPRVRFSVLGENGSEIYSWTALLPRSILYPRERVPFKSRLASPPTAGNQVMVRFLTRGDLTAAVR